MKKIDNPLRIKVTGNCNRECVFCHHEGGDCNIEEIHPNKALKSNIRKLSSQLDIHVAALTGGEPLMHSDLPEIAAFLYADCGLEKIYMTSNGMIKRDISFWKEMKRCGLDKVNISVPDIFNEYKKRSKSLESFFQNQLHNMKCINSLDINVDVNVVVFNDYEYTKFVIDTLNSLKEDGFEFHIYLLPNLSIYDYGRSISTIKTICEKMGYKEKYTCIMQGISNSSRRYQDEVGNQLFVKSTEKDNKVFLLPGLCDNCAKRDVCLEGFYGLRLEQREGIYYIRLCLLKSTSDVLIPFDDFFQSDICRILQRQWQNC